MNPDDLRDYVRRKPFEPFRLHLTDGSTFDIRHPEMILIARRTVAVGLPASAGSTEADRITTISILHIVRAEPIEAPAPGANP